MKNKLNENTNHPSAFEFKRMLNEGEEEEKYIDDVQTKQFLRVLTALLRKKGVTDSATLTRLVEVINRIANIARVNGYSTSSHAMMMKYLDRFD